MDNRETLKALVELAKKATPGPWETQINGVGKTKIQGKQSVFHWVGNMYLDGEWAGNADFVVAARNAIPALEALLQEEPVAYLSPDDGRVVNALDRIRMDDGAASYFTIPLFSSPPATVPVSELEALADEWQKLSTTVPHNPLDKGRYQCAKDLRSLINRSHK